VGLERGQLGLRLTTAGDPPRWPGDTSLSTKVGSKFRQQVAVARSVYFARRLKATEFVLLCTEERIRGWIHIQAH
jgi:hypothetical protein